MDDPDFAGVIKNFLLKKVYERLRSTSQDLWKLSRGFWMHLKVGFSARG
jgi:hypothetical protein